jgi:hypothetical protein
LSERTCGFESHALRKTASDQGSCFQTIEVLGRAFDAVDGFRTVVHDPDWPYFVEALRLLIRTFVDSVPTNGGCNGLSSIKPFPETVLLQVRDSVDLHVRDPTVPGSRGLSTNCQRRDRCTPHPRFPLDDFSDRARMTLAATRVGRLFVIVGAMRFRVHASVS